MKKRINLALFLLLAIIFMSLSKENYNTQTVNEKINRSYKIEAGSVITWKALHNKDSDFAHIGTVDITEGTIAVTENDLVSGEVIFDITTIKKTGKETQWTLKLENHLKDHDFFNVKLFPNSKFTINKYEKNIVTGSLEILGISNEISFPIDITINSTELHAKGEFKINLLPFKMKKLVAAESLSEDKKLDAPSPFITFEVDIKAAIE